MQPSAGKTEGKGEAPGGVPVTVHKGGGKM